MKRPTRDRVRSTAAGWLVHVGTDNQGGRLVVPVDGRHILIAGATGSGKSNTVQCVLAGLADAGVPVAFVLVDPKRVELVGWSDRAAAHAVEPAEVVEVLAALLAFVHERYKKLETARLRTWPETMGPRVLLVVDELAEVLASGDREKDRANAATMRRLLSIGRAAGVTVLGATQRPSHDVIPTSVRDLFGYRLCHAVNDAEAVAMILGVSAKVAPAHELPIGPAHAGLCFVAADGVRGVVRGRSLFISDEVLAGVQAAAAFVPLPGFGAAPDDLDGGRCEPLRATEQREGGSTTGPTFEAAYRPGAVFSWR